MNKIFSNNVKPLPVCGQPFLFSPLLMDLSVVVYLAPVAAIVWTHPSQVGAHHSCILRGERFPPGVTTGGNIQHPQFILITEAAPVLTSLSW